MLSMSKFWSDLTFIVFCSLVKTVGGKRAKYNYAKAIVLPLRVCVSVIALMFMVNQFSSLYALCYELLEIKELI